MPSPEVVLLKSPGIAHPIMGHDKVAGHTGDSDSDHQKGGANSRKTL